MGNQIERFTAEFFKNLKCSVLKEGDILVVGNVPKSFEDLFGKAAPYRISFVSGVKGCEFVRKGSTLLGAMTKFLEGAGKTTLLKIDFDVDPETEIGKAISLKNCEINNLVKRHKNNFFSRFTFMTTFRYMNETEQIVNEIYVHDGKIVNGSLDGYTVVEGIGNEASSAHVEKDYGIARGALKDLLQDKTTEIGETLGERVEVEVARIRKHYENLLGELGGDLSETIKKINETELDLRTALAARDIPFKEGTDVPSSSGKESEIETLRARLNRLRRGLVKMGDDDSRDRILKEQDFTIKDAMQKHSLNIDNKLVNTTVIYYPVFSFDLFLRAEAYPKSKNNGAKNGSSSGRFVEMNYDPLTKTLDKLKCESCGEQIVRLNLCSTGHINCDNCLERCGECSKSFCQKCVKRNCSSCGKGLCKDCSIMCLGCGKHACATHIRNDCVSGDDRCVICLRACLRCHGSAQAKYFGEALDGSKVCQKCLGAEKRGAALKKVFEE